ncbi:hypothetical protein CACET_c15940 [Clostridium aceticum]|uniref:Uncharacterized protein n=2 Tax=Clostridium aceticum TaxID=84022 RepID=A0A0D8ICD6_9CLOT|nr:hypothetical protein [Clostridium aceticum]AKL95043.1 hypothetical protein CACET_c15940 [Clostridium aceticum]KJF27933.1 hypothetical protein TZ02_05020 [Clostridium aceticum]
MASSIIDIIFHGLMGVFIVLVGIGAVYRQYWWEFRRYGNKKEEESFYTTLQYLWKKNLFYIALSLLPVILACIIHVIFRR